jgi:hypothetical protein
MHQWTQQALLQPETLHCLPRAAMAAHLAAALASTALPITLLARRGHPLLAESETASHCAATATVVAIESDELRAVTLQRLLLQ